MRMESQYVTHTRISRSSGECSAVFISVATMKQLALNLDCAWERLSTMSITKILKLAYSSDEIPVKAGMVCLKRGKRREEGRADFVCSLFR